MSQHQLLALTGSTIVFCVLVLIFNHFYYNRVLAVVSLIVSIIVLGIVIYQTYLRHRG